MKSLNLSCTCGPQTVQIATSNFSVWFESYFFSVIRLQCVCVHVKGGGYKFVPILHECVCMCVCDGLRVQVCPYSARLCVCVTG